MFDRVFVTVGTTSFQPLIQIVVSNEAVDLFKKWGVKEVRIQAGKHNNIKLSDSWTEKNIQFEIYDYKTSITDDMRWADLIICHAGAGTTIEALDLKKVLLVVPNEALMDNHQLELARKLDKEKYAFMATIGEFFERATEVDPKKVKPFPQPCPQSLNDYLINEVFNK